MSSKTTILLLKETRDNLRSLGKKGMSYDSLVQELIALKKEEIELNKEVTESLRIIKVINQHLAEEPDCKWYYP